GQQLEQRVALARDPEVHRIAGDELRLLHLVETIELQFRIDVAQEDPLSTAERFRNMRPELGEHAEPGLQRLPRVEVEVVDARPAKAFAGEAHHAGQISVPAVEEVEAGLREVLTDHPDHLHPAEARGGSSEERRRSAESVLGTAERRFYRIQRDTANHVL